MGCLQSDRVSTLGGAQRLPGTSSTAGDAKADPDKEAETMKTNTVEQPTAGGAPAETAEGKRWRVLREIVTMSRDLEPSGPPGPGITARNVLSDVLELLDELERHDPDVVKTELATIYRAFEQRPSRA